MSARDAVYVNGIEFEANHGYTPTRDVTLNMSAIGALRASHGRAHPKRTQRWAF